MCNLKKTRFSNIVFEIGHNYSRFRGSGTFETAKLNLFATFRGGSDDAEAGKWHPTEICFFLGSALLVHGGAPIN